MQHRGKARFEGARVFEFEEEIVNVSRHADLVVLASIVPFDVHASKFVTGHV
jgi:hypothetical protein